MITARAGGLLGLVAAWRLASRLVGGGRSGAFAGLLAVVGVVLTQDWFYYWQRGTSEVVLIGASLWAVDRLLDGHRTQAFLLAVAAGLIRPEWWPFIGLYALWLWLRDPAFGSWPMRLLLLAGLFSLPFLWFVPPWVGSGQPFLAASHAAQYNGHLGSDPFRAVVGRGIDLQVLPALLAAVIAVAIGWWRDRDRVLLAIGVGIAAWWVEVVAMTLDGYPGLERFFLPAAALTCVLGGVGIVRLAQLAGAGRARSCSGGDRGRRRDSGADLRAVHDHPRLGGPGHLARGLPGGHDPGPADPGRGGRGRPRRGASRASPASSPSTTASRRRWRGSSTRRSSASGPRCAPRESTSSGPTTAPTAHRPESTRG